MVVVLSRNKSSNKFFLNAVAVVRRKPLLSQVVAEAVAAAAAASASASASAAAPKSSALNRATTPRRLGSRSQSPASERRNTSTTDSNNNDYLLKRYFCRHSCSRLRACLSNYQSTLKRYNYLRRRSSASSSAPSPNAKPRQAFRCPNLSVCCSALRQTPKTSGPPDTNAPVPEMLGKLVVRVYRAEGLAAADINGKSDPFVKMLLVNQFHRTSTQYKTLNPEWNEMFHFDVLDINNHLDLLVYDEDRHGEDFLGRIVIPLLSIKNKRQVWYQLKDKKLQSSAKGRVLLRMDIEWSLVKACMRTFNPLEKLKDPPPATLRKSVVVSNFIRAKTQIMLIVNLLQYIRSCFEWQYKLRSLLAFFIFVVITYHFELWMLPFALLCLFGFNLAIMSSPTIRDLLGFDEAKFSSLTDIRHIIASDDSTYDIQLQEAGKMPTKQVGDSNNNTSSASANCATNNPDEDNKTFVERIQAGKDVVILCQDIVGNIASYLERVTNTFTFKVPFLSYLMMFCLLVASVLLYFVPLRWVVLAWGVNKFTKKLRDRNAIDNNELVDFLSRVPDNVQCIKAQNIISY